MGRKRRQHSEQFKFKVALEASKGIKTVNELASEYEVHPNQISSWKKQLLTEGARVFSRNGGRQQAEQAAQEAELYEQIGRLKMELEWLKKTSLAEGGIPPDEKRPGGSTGLSPIK